MVEPGLPLIERKEVGKYTFRICDRLGKGAFGSVYKGHVKKKEALSDEMPEVAIKMVPFVINDEQYDELTTMLDREVNLMQELSHDRILKLIDVLMAKRNIYLITELCNGGDLEARKKDITVGEALFVVKEIAQAMRYAHKQKVIHRDIKPANILIHNGHVKVADFGLARAVDRPDIMGQYTQQRGSPLYMSPQVFHGEDYGTKCDVWSLGVLLYELLFKKPPWYGSNPHDLFKNIKKQPLNLDPEEDSQLFYDLDEDIQDLLRHMLEKTEDERFDFKKVLAHDAFKRKLPEKLKK